MLCGKAYLSVNSQKSHAAVPPLFFVANGD
jgi:hypothetical protein